jgi:hypothetical protein
MVVGLKFQVTGLRRMPNAEEIKPTFGTGFIWFAVAFQERRWLATQLFWLGKSFNGF